jgi:cell division protein FtsB
MRLLFVALGLLFALLQYRLWFSQAGLLHAWQTQQAISAMNEENETMKKKNDVLAADVQDLKQGTDAIEERARTELGMVKQGETFYQISN